MFLTRQLIRRPTVLSSAHIGARIQPLSTSSSRSDDVIGFIGLGQMGGHMATNLLKQGKKVIVYDISDVKPNELKLKYDADIASTPKDVASAANLTTVVTMLPSSPHVEEVYLGANGLLEGIKPDTLFIDCSTIDPNTAQKVSSAVEEKRCGMVDAPVSGGVTGAEAATLTFMVGGSEESFLKSKTILSLMGKNIVHCGKSGTGQVAKLCNNLALAIEMIAVSEAMTLGEKLGMDPKTLAGIMNTSSSQCWSSSVYNPFPGVIDGVPASRDYEGGFASVLMRKDLGLALDAAKSVEASVPFTASAHQLYNMLAQQGYGQKDFGVILKYLQGK